MDTVPLPELEDFVRRATLSVAGPGAEAQVDAFAAATVWCDAVGRSTHGVWRLPAYLRRVEEGLIACPAQVSVTEVSPAACRIDGGNGLGQYVASRAMDEALSRARSTGIATALVRRSNHFGAAGYFVERAARAGAVAIVTSNSFAKVAAHGGVRPIFGTNPIALGIPRAGADPVVADMATAAIAGSAVLRAAERGEELSPGIVIGADGAPITDARRAQDGVMLTFGAAKGSALALLVEVLAGCLAGAEPSTRVRSMFHDFDGAAGLGHNVLVLDPSALGADGFQDSVESLLDDLTSSGPGGARVRLPGDVRWEAARRARAEGCALPEGALRAIDEVAQRYGVDPPAST